VTPKEMAAYNGHNAYIAYDRIGGPEEEAYLVFAPTAKEAKKISHGVSMYGSEWIDWKAKRLRDLPDHLWEMYQGHAGTCDDPPTCPRCEMWGGHKAEDETGECCSFCEGDDS